MNEQVLYGGFRRLDKFAIDPSSRFETRRELETYLKNSDIAYEGQQICVYGDSKTENNGIYSILKPVEIKEEEKEFYEKFFENIEGVLITKTPTAMTKIINAELGIVKEDLGEVSGKVATIETFFSGTEGGEGNNLTLPKITDAIKELQAIVTGKEDTEGKTAFEEIRDEILATDSKVDDNAEAIEYLKSQIGIGSSGEGSLSSKIEKVSNDITAINNKIEKIDIILDLLDNNMNDNSITLEIEKLTHTFNSLKAEIEDLEKRLREDLLSSEAIVSINNRIDTLEGTTSNIPTIFSDISTLQEEDSKLRQKIADAEGLISSTQTDVKTLSEKKASIQYVDEETNKLKENISSVEGRVSSIQTDVQTLSEKKASIQYVNEYVNEKTSTLNSNISSEIARVESNFNNFKDNIQSNIESFISYDGVRRTHNFDITGTGKEQTHWCTGDSVAMHHVGDTLNKITIQVKAAPENFDEHLNTYSNYSFRCLIGNRVLFDEDDIIFSDIGSFYEFLINQKITEEINNFGFSVNLPSSVTIGVSVDYIGAKKTNN